MYTTSGIVKLLERAELTIVQIAEATDTPIAKVGDVALYYWYGLPETTDVVATRHTITAKMGGLGDPENSHLYTGSQLAEQVVAPVCNG